MQTECLRLFGCTRPQYGRTGLCRPHYTQRCRGEELRPLRIQGCKLPTDPTGVCTALCGCDRSVLAKGLCGAHYDQASRGRELVPIRQVNHGVRDSEGRKRCGVCSEWKSESEFHLKKSCPDGLMPRCKRCDRNAKLVRKYKITVDQFDALLTEQGGVCAICMSESTRPGFELSVDHDHRCCPGTTSCGKCVRRLLCSNCNLVLGAVQDNVDRLKAMIYYLEEMRIA